MHRSPEEPNLPRKMLIILDISRPTNSYTSSALPASFHPSRCQPTNFYFRMRNRFKNLEISLRGNRNLDRTKMAKSTNNIKISRHSDSMFSKTPAVNSYSKFSIHGFILVEDSSIEQSRLLSHILES